MLEKVEAHVSIKAHVELHFFLRAAIRGKYYPSTSLLHRDAGLQRKILRQKWIGDPLNH